MTKTEGLKILTELEAAEKLIARGYMRRDCERCAGLGHLRVEEHPIYADMPVIRQCICSICEGAGWVWVEPSPSK